jgi:hypothetical protein
MAACANPATPPHHTAYTRPAPLGAHGVRGNLFMPGQHVSQLSRVRAAPAVDPTRTQRAPAEAEQALSSPFDARRMRPGTLLRLQRASGNGAVVGLLNNARRAPAGVVQRVSLKDLRISRGIYHEAHKEQNTVFFRLTDAALADTEMKKIETIAQTYPNAAMELSASASEDELLIEHPKVDVDELLTRRLNAVVGALEQKGFKGKLVQTRKPKSGLGQIDYRESRQVEIILPGRTSKRADEQAPHFVTATSEHTSRWDDAVKLANGLIDPAVTALDNRDLDPTLAQLVTRFFGNVRNAGEVADYLVDIKKHINSSANHLLEVEDNKPKGAPGYVVAGPGNPKYRSSLAYNTGVGGESVLALCASFFTDDILEAATTVIHEAAHGTPGLKTRDYAYLSERAIEFLNEDRAMFNSDSYVLLVQLFQKPASVTPGVQQPDKLPSTMAEQDQIAARRAVAWVEKWLVAAYQDVGSLYGEVTSLESGERVTNAYYAKLMEELYVQFDLTNPEEAGPTDQDRVALAGIHDRVLEMRDYFVSSIDFQVGGEAVVWQPAGHKLTLPEGFFKLDPIDQCEDVLVGVLRGMPEVASVDRTPFFDVIMFCKKLSGVGDPT